MDTRSTIILGEKEFAFHKIPAFQANSLILKIQKIALPIMGGLFGKAGGGLEMDLKDAARVISENIDEKVMAEIVMPLLKLANVSNVTEGFKIDSEAAFSKSFTVDTLADFYVLLFEVLRFNFESFFMSLANRFGLESAALPVQKT
jgi:hypothetical protein